MNQLRYYFRGLSAEVGSRWNRFWFEPSDAYDLCVFRFAVGILALIWQLSYSPDLMRWFGPQGWFDGGVLNQWLTAESTSGFSGRLSFLYMPDRLGLWVCHVISAVVLTAFALGLFTRVTSILSFVVVLAYVHRAPFVCGATEVVLTMMVGYLCLAPCGEAFSLSTWISKRSPANSGRTIRRTSWATLARRLLQVHLVAIYLIMALSKLGAATWWNGEAIWWLAAQPLSQKFDFSNLRDVPLVLNLWTYAILISEFSFAVCVWNLWLRPLVLVATTISWISLAVATGSLALPITMIVAGLVFVPSWFWKHLFARSVVESVPAEN